MSRRIRLVLSYDGAGFHGWQKQEGLRTVEGCLLAALERLTQGTVITAGASRTDQGVHALGQSVLATIESTLELSSLERGLEALTPRDLSIVRCLEAPGGFDPRRSAVEKRYLYRILNRARKPVFRRQRVWWVRRPLAIDAMNDAAAALRGTHDFAAFRNRSKGEPEDTVRTLRSIGWRAVGDEVVFQVIGTGFLYRMVRNLVGTLVEVGFGRREASEAREILESRDRRRAGTSAPPDGLYLMEVSYSDTPPCEVDPKPKFSDRP